MSLWNSCFAVGFALMTACASVAKSVESDEPACDPEYLLEIVEGFVFADDEQETLKRAQPFSSIRVQVAISQDEVFNLSREASGPVFLTAAIAGAQGARKRVLEGNLQSIDEFGVMLMAPAMLNSASVDLDKYQEVSLVNGCRIYTHRNDWRVIAVFDQGNVDDAMQEIALQCYVRAFLVHIGIASAAKRPFDEIARCTKALCTDRPSLMLSAFHLNRPYSRNGAARSEFKTGFRSEVCEAN